MYLRGLPYEINDYVSWEKEIKKKLEFSTGKILNIKIMSNKDFLNIKETNSDVYSINPLGEDNLDKGFWNLQKNDAESDKYLAKNLSEILTKIKNVTNDSEKPHG